MQLPRADGQKGLKAVVCFRFSLEERFGRIRDEESHSPREPELYRSVDN